MSQDHPSFFQLDRFANGSSIAPARKAHIDSCPQCAAHLARLQTKEPVPAWAREVDRHARAKRPARWAWAGGFAMAAAAFLLVVYPGKGPERPQTEEIAYTTVKGAPSVGVYVKRAGKIILWNGQTAISPGDKVRLKIVPEGYRHVTVFSESEDPQGPRYIPLFAGPLANEYETLLPTAWEVDATPRDEIIVVVLSAAPINKSDIRERGIRATKNAWSTRLVIPKDSH